MKSFTARVPCCAKCRATIGRSLRICGFSTVICSAIPGRSSYLWATNSASGRSGITTQASNGICSRNRLHAGLKRWVRDLNTLYRGQPLLHEMEFNSAGFEWVDCKDSQRSIISFLRRGRNPNDQLLFVCNFTPVVRENYRVGVPLDCYWKEILNSDAALYGGSGQGNFGGLTGRSASDSWSAFLLEYDSSSAGNCCFPAGI